MDKSVKYALLLIYLMMLYSAVVINGLTNCSQKNLMKLEFEILFHLNSQALAANSKSIRLRREMFNVFHQSSFTLYNIIQTPSIH